MKNWTFEGHLSELGLELRAAAEVRPDELAAMNAHLRECAACRARSEEWHALLSGLAALRPVEPSPGFDDRVMARIRVPASASSRATAGWRGFARRLRPALLGAAATWVTAVVGAGAWLLASTDVPAGVLLAGIASAARDLLLAAAIEVGTFLHLSGVTALWNQVADTVPGTGLAAAVATMTALSGLAVWTLYRVNGQPPRIGAHA